MHSRVPCHVASKARSLQSNHQALCQHVWCICCCCLMHVLAEGTRSPMFSWHDCDSVMRCSEEILPSSCHEEHYQATCIYVMLHADCHPPAADSASPNALPPCCGPCHLPSPPWSPAGLSASHTAGCRNSHLRISCAAAEVPPAGEDDHTRVPRSETIRSGLQ